MVVDKWDFTFVFFAKEMNKEKLVGEEVLSNPLCHVLL
jgi:hypothetical protein